MGLISGTWRGTNLLANSGGPGPKKPPNPNGGGGGRGLGRGGRGRGQPGVPGVYPCSTIWDSTYYLEAEFTADDQVFSDAQVLDSAAEGVGTGNLTVELDGTSNATAEISSNQLKLTTQNGGQGFADGVMGVNRTKELGMAMLWSHEAPDLSENNVFGLWANADFWVWSTDYRLAQVSIAPGGSDEMKAVTYLNAGNSQEAHSATTLSRVGMNINTQMPTALVVGGYDSAGVPYYAGQTKANYTYGHSVFFKEQGVWKIFFKDRRDDSERIKPIIATRSSTNAKISYTDYCKQPDADLSGTLLPIVLDRFTDTANTPLLNHTPDVGNNWTAAGTLGASFKISSANTLVDDSISGWDAAIQDVSIGDVFVEIEPIMPSSFGRSLTAIYVNVVDDSNYWRVDVDSTANARAVKIIEGVDAVHTTRASYTENSTFVADGVYRAAVITDADGIQANFYDRNGGASYINEEISYSVVDRPHKTATSHGFGMNSVDTGTALDNFVLYPRGTGGEYACLDEVI